MIDRLAHWLAAHPEMLIHAWPIVTAIFLALVTSRDDEDFDALPPWRQKLILFVKASGLDVRAALNAVKPRGAKSIPPPASKGGERGFCVRDPAMGMVGACLLIVLAFPACALLTPKSALSVLDIAQTACIIANQASSDADVQKACAIADELAPPMRRVLAESRTASARAVAASRASGSANCGDDK